MSTTAASFYVTGGTLRQDAPSYVERQADKDLHEGLLQGEFCYVLTSRQMGKSSLMVHTAARLREEGVAVAVLDLTAIGQNLSAEQWYGGLLRRVGLQLDASGELEEELDHFWFEQAERVGPLERWMTALQRIVLPRIPGRIVIFIDEIDAVRSLPFSTDELLAAVRECYNRRTRDPEFQRLTFCLLGVAAPSDLIRDTRTTPFNIGHRVELNDFTEAEAAPLARGLGRGDRSSRRLLQRVLYWTGGHPYLTQRLCRAASEDETASDPAGVDRLCEALFLSAQAQERDDNLLFVRERLLKSEADRAGLLDLYREVRSGKPVRLDDTNQLVTILRLSGITRVAEGRLRVRNRIYERVFDREWITQHMPDAELRRQRAAYRRGLLRATGISTAVLAVMAALALTALSQARFARRQQQIALEGQRRLQSNLYAADMNVAQQAWEGGDVRRVLELLEAHRPGPGQEDLRGWEWRYLWRLCQQGRPRATLRGHTGPVLCVTYSPNGRMLASASDDGTVRLWDAVSGHELRPLATHQDHVARLAFSPDGKLLATEGNGVRLWQTATHRELAVLDPKPCPWGHGMAFSADGKTLAAVSSLGGVQLWDVVSRRPVMAVREHPQVTSLALSPDGKTLATGSVDEFVRLWDLPGRRPRGSFHVVWGNLFALTFSPDGQRLATGCYDPVMKLWDIASRQQVAPFAGHHAAIFALAFSPDGKLLASGSNDNTARLWSVATHQELATFRGHDAEVWSVAFSPDGRTLATGSYDKTIKLWDVFPKPEVSALKGHTAGLWALAFSPDSKTLVTGSADQTFRLWDLATGRARAVLNPASRPVQSAAFSPDGRLLATGNGGWVQGPHAETILIWDVRNLRRVGALPGHMGTVYALAFSPDGKTLASASSDGTVRFWNLKTRQALVAFHGPTRAGVGRIVFSPNGKTVAWGSIGDETVRLWDLSGDPLKGGGLKLRTLGGHRSGLTGVAFSPDGKTLVSGSFDKTARLWDVRTGREIGRLEADRGVVDWQAFAPDGKTLALSHQDGTVTLWNLATGRQVLTLKDVWCAAFSPDGQLLATVDKSNTVRLWRAATFAETDAAPPRRAAR